MDSFPLNLNLYEYHCVEEDQTVHLIPWLRITSVVYVGTDQTPRDGLVDTGSALTVVPEPFWTAVASEIRWLSPASGVVLPNHLTTVGGVTGGETAPCRLGLIDLKLLHLPSWETLPLPALLCKFAADGGRLPRRIYLGLAGLLQRRWLQAWFEAAWLTDNSPDDVR